MGSRNSKLNVDNVYGIKGFKEQTESYIENVKSHNLGTVSQSNIEMTNTSLEDNFSARNFYKRNVIDTEESHKGIAVKG